MRTSGTPRWAKFTPVGVPEASFTLFPTFSSVVCLMSAFQQNFICVQKFVVSPSSYFNLMQIRFIEVSVVSFECQVSGTIWEWYSRSAESDDVIYRCLWNYRNVVIFLHIHDFHQYEPDLHEIEVWWRWNEELFRANLKRLVMRTSGTPRWAKFAPGGTKIRWNTCISLFPTFSSAVCLMSAFQKIFYAIKNMLLHLNHTSISCKLDQ